MGGKGKGKGKVNVGKLMEKKFQVKLGGEFKDYSKEEDAVLKRAFLVGQPNARFHLRGQGYEYNFKSMKQKNLDSGKERDIRAPPGVKAPKEPLLPTGPMIVINVPPGSAGQTISVNDPNNPGQKIQVNVPASAKKGSKMAVPIPEKGEDIKKVQEKQQKGSAGWSTGAKTAMGVAAVGGLAVGGVVLGDYLSGGAVEDWAGDVGITDAAADAGDWAAGAAGDAGDWAAGAAGDFAETDAGEWVVGAGADAGDWIGGAADDAGDWLGDAAEDGGDFIMSLF